MTVFKSRPRGSKALYVYLLSSTESFSELPILFFERFKQSFRLPGDLSPATIVPPNSGSLRDFLALTG